MTTTKIEFGSEAYFALIANNPMMSKYLALGSRVIVVVNGVAYEITDTGVGATSADTVPTAIPAQPTPAARNITQSNASSVPSNPGVSVCGGGFLGIGLIGGVLAFTMLRKHS